MATPYWTWDGARKQHYHAERNRITGKWVYIWANNSTPQTPIVSYTDSSPHPRPTPHPVEPYGTQPRAVGVASITQNLAHLNVSGGQTPPSNLQSRQPVAARLEASHQRATYYPQKTSSMLIEPSHSIQSADRHYRAPLTRYDRPSAERYEVVQDKRTSFNRGGTAVSQYQTPRRAIDESRSYTGQVTEAENTGLTNYPRRSQIGSSSQEAQASSASYSYSTRDGFADPRNEKLNPREFKQIHDPKRFFVVGMVFIMFYIENAGQTADQASHGGTNFTSVAHGEIAHHQFRRFVVVQEKSRELFCYCCPITTYGGRATNKPGVDQSAHTIVYSTEHPPEKLSGETKMLKDPLRVILSSPDDKLDSKSRINLGREYPIDHNVKIKKIGDVHPRSLQKLIAYRRAIRNEMP